MERRKKALNCLFLYCTGPELVFVFEPAAGTLGYFTEEVVISYEGLLSCLVRILKVEGFLPREAAIVFQPNMTIGNLLDQCSAHLGTAV